MENTQPQNSKEQAQNPKNESGTNFEMPKIENYLHPLTLDSLKSLEPKFELIFSGLKNKLESGKPSLFIKPSDFELSKDDYKQYFKFTTSEAVKDDKEEYSNIIDFHNFIHYVKSEEELKSIDKVNAEEMKYASA